MKFRGEIIVHRRNNLDFKLELHNVASNITKKLPKHSYEERINHYNNKVKQCFRRER